MEGKNIKGYEYITRENGTVTAKGCLQNNAASRKGMSSIKSAGEGYQKGHLIAARENGAVVKENVFSQVADLNQGRYKTMENAEMRLVQKDAAQVYTEKTAYISNPQNEGLLRPDAYMINDTIIYEDGHTNTVNLSFANISTSEQELLNDESAFVAFDNDIENPEDTLRDRMTEEEYTELMETTDRYLPNIGDEYTEHIENISSDIDLSLEDITIEQDGELTDYNIDNGINEDGAFANNDVSNDMNNDMGDVSFDIGGE